MEVFHLTLSLLRNSFRHVLVGFDADNQTDRVPVLCAGIRGPISQVQVAVQCLLDFGWFLSLSELYR